MRLTIDEIQIIFDALEKQYGRGYSKVVAVGRLQAKLSIMAEVLSKQSAAESKETRT